MDMGEADSANRSTANTLSKIATQSVEALQRYIKTFIETYVINEILLEGGFAEALVDSEKMVSIKFGSVDKEEKSKEENQTIQLWLNNLISEKEARKRLGEQPVEDSMRDETNYKLYQEPLALLKAMGPFSAASNALAKSPSSSISEEGNKIEEVNAEKQSKQAGRKLDPANGAKNLSNNISRPANQQGVREAPKFSKDTLELFEEIKSKENLLNLLELLEKSQSIK